MQTHEAFLAGYKPAFLCSHRYDSGALKQLLDLGYPHLLYYELEDFDKPDEIFDRGTLFFCDDNLKNEYLQETKGIGTFSRGEILLIGRVLGFPPIASKFYVDCDVNEELKEKHAGFDYYGICFAGNIDDAESISKWLWDNVPAPLAAVEVRYQDEIRFIEPSVVTL